MKSHYESPYVSVFYPPDHCTMSPLRPRLPRCEGEFHVDSVVGAPLAAFRTGDRGKGLHGQDIPASGIQVRPCGRDTSQKNLNNSSRPLPPITRGALAPHHFIQGDGGGMTMAAERFPQAMLLRVSSGCFIHENWQTPNTKSGHWGEKYVPSPPIAMLAQELPLD